tara:strand:- start:232 stop:534 length:303 start_codon:yes stop_codon:yes gene_type:complete
LSRRRAFVVSNFAAVALDFTNPKTEIAKRQPKMMIASSVDPNMGKPLCAALCMDDNEDMARNVPAFDSGVVSSTAGREQFSGWRVTPLQIATPDFGSPDD